MSIDFTTKKKAKTNYEYLKDILARDKEGLEFLEGFKKEKESEIIDLQDELREAEDTIHEKDTEITNLEEEKALAGVINVRMGPNDNIRWEAGNLACKSLMEELDNAIGRGIPILKIENILRAI